jgi:ankyrin repeat protein
MVYGMTCLFLFVLASFFFIGESYYSVKMTRISHLPVVLAYAPEQSLRKQAQTTKHQAHAPNMITSYSASQHQVLFNKWKYRTRTLTRLCMEDPMRGMISPNLFDITFHEIHVAASCGKSSLVSTLIDKGVGVDSRDFLGNTALNLAVMGGHQETVALLLEKGAAVDGVLELDNTSFLNPQVPLHIAAFHGHSEIAKMLIKNGADIDCSRNFSGKVTALHLAARLGHQKFVALLLENGAAVKGPLNDTAEVTPLHLAAFHGNAEIVFMLIDSGADIDCKDLDGMTALHRAVLGGRAACVSALLASGADTEVANAEGRTAMYVASKRGSSQCFKLLREHADKKSKARLLLAAPSLRRDGDFTPNAAAAGSVSEQRKARTLQVFGPAIAPPLLLADAFFDLLRAGSTAGRDRRIPEQFSWANAQLALQVPATGPEEGGEEDMVDAAMREVVIERDSDLSPGVVDGSVPGKENAPRLPQGRLGDDGDILMAEQPPLDEIELAPLAMKWLDKADRPAREMLLSRLGRLAQGRRSYALSKRLKNTRCACSSAASCERFDSSAAAVVN